MHNSLGENGIHTWIEEEEAGDVFTPGNRKQWPACSHHNDNGTKKPVSLWQWQRIGTWLESLSLSDVDDSVIFVPWGELHPAENISASRCSDTFHCPDVCLVMTIRISWEDFYSSCWFPNKYCDGIRWQYKWYNDELCCLGVRHFWIRPVVLSWTLVEDWQRRE